MLAVGLDNSSEVEVEENVTSNVEVLNAVYDDLWRPANKSETHLQSVVQFTYCTYCNRFTL